MNKSCYTCDKDTKGWATVSNYSSKGSTTYCSYDCYKENPMIVPSEAYYKSTSANNDDTDDNEHVIIPVTNYEDKNDNFIFLSETDINQLTSQGYSSYKQHLEEYFCMNPHASEIYHTNLENDKREKELEDEFNESDTEDESDDY